MGMDEYSQEKSELAEETEKKRPQIGRKKWIVQDLKGQLKKSHKKRIVNGPIILQTQLK